MALGALATTVSITLIATQPVPQTYWAQCFPSIIALSFGPHFIFTAAQIIASNAVKRKHQGIAGDLIGTVASYGLSTGLSFAATVEAYTNDNWRKLVLGYRNTLYLGIGIAGAATLLALGFVRIPKDEREGWDEDDDAPQNATLERRPGCLAIDPWWKSPAREIDVGPSNLLDTFFRLRRTSSKRSLSHVIRSYG